VEIVAAHRPQYLASGSLVSRAAEIGPAHCSHLP
jgi:hypothetical protein